MPITITRPETGVTDLKNQAYEPEGEALLRCREYYGSANIERDLSCGNVLTLFFRHEIHVDPRGRRNPELDRFVLRNGHAAVCMYIAMSIRGFLLWALASLTDGRKAA